MVAGGVHQLPRPRSPGALDKPYRFVRLPGLVDVGPLVAELPRAAQAFVDSVWKWHILTRFAPLRGGPVAGHPTNTLVTGLDLDMPALRWLPELRRFLDAGLPVRARLAWLGQSPPGARIFLHRDNLPHWDEHHRVHLPLITSPGARLGVDGHFAHMPAGTLWAFNNSRVHGGVNDGPPRVHLVMDLPSTPEVEAWIAAGERVEGTPDPALWRELAADPLEAFTEAQLADQALMAVVRQQ